MAEVKTLAPLKPGRSRPDRQIVNPQVVDAKLALLEAGLAGPLVVHGTTDPDYSYRSVARLSKRSYRFESGKPGEMTWPAIAQKF